jgi:hypothetical protein
MCDAHFHPFPVIISPLHAMGVKIYPKKIGGTLTPGHPIGALAPRLNALVRTMAINNNYNTHLFRISLSFDDVDSWLSVAPFVIPESTSESESRKK